MIHWVPVSLSPSDKLKVESMVTVDLSGGFQSLSTYDLVDATGRVVDSTTSSSLNDAGTHFLMQNNKRVDPITMPFIPIDMRNAVLDSINQNVMCSCEHACTDPTCERRTAQHAQRYIQSYMQFAAQPSPSHVLVRHNDTVTKFTPTYVRVDPSVDAVRDGVVARMRVDVS